jgi:ADP-ribose pyrophosphatase YjhB (NUDIX family)
MKDETQTIAIALVRCSGYVLIGKMKDDAENKLAGEYCLPGVGVEGDKTLRSELVRYMRQATGLTFEEDEFSRILGTMERVVQEDDKSQRYVRHVFLTATIIRHIKPGLTPGCDMADVHWMPEDGPKGIRAVLHNGDTSWERTPAFVFTALNGN